jgi:hypothetical protein
VDDGSHQEEFEKISVLFKTDQVEGDSDPTGKILRASGKIKDP